MRDGPLAIPGSLAIINVGPVEQCRRRFNEAFSGHAFRAVIVYNALMTFRFDLLHTDGKARLGRISTAHGIVETPVFMAVGTQASVKALTPGQLLEANVQVVLGNTYHLALRPGD